MGDFTADLSFAGLLVIVSGEPVLRDVKTYSILRTSSPKVSGEKLGNSPDAYVDLFVRRRGCGMLHLFASRFGSAQTYLSDRDVAQDIDSYVGIVELPDGKKSRNELKSGDVLNIYLKNDKSGVPIRHIYEKTL